MYIIERLHVTKIAFTSDIHLEFGDIELVNKHNADILVLAGDISTPHKWREDGYVYDVQSAFFKRVSQAFGHVIYVPGNHEHYHGDVNETENILKEELAQYDNVTFGTHVEYDGGDFAIIGNTLWTDFEAGNPIVLNAANMGMNDFRVVRNGGHRFTSDDARRRHMLAKFDISESAYKFADKKLIVVSHHLPSYQVIAAGFKDSRLNGAYASDLDEFMQEINASVWIHGHSHPPADLMIGMTRVIRKPRGYVNYEHSWDDDKKYEMGLIEV
jgi:predicted phosphodiesterase